MTYNPERSLPRSRVLRWLADAGAGTPLPIQLHLLAEMVSASPAALMGPLSGMIIDAMGIALRGGRIFVVLLLLETALLGVRLVILRHRARRAARGLATPPDMYLFLVLCWCALQGATAFFSLISQIRALQILGATSVAALLGPICARNYGAPRYAVLLLALCFLPLVAGAQLCGEPALLVMIAQAPLLFLGVGAILKRYRALSSEALLARDESHFRAQHDSLTGLLNRSGLAEHFSRLDGTMTAFALFYLDLDGFKPVNDTYGHKAGDVLLASVADRLRHCVRAGDIVARIGGDEFVIVAVGAQPADVAELSDRFIREIVEIPYRVGPDTSLHIGVTMGCACAPEDGRAFFELQNRADAALYEAKRAGKGICRRYREPAFPTI